MPKIEKKIPLYKECVDAWEEEDPDLAQIKSMLESGESELASAESTLELIDKQGPYIGSVYNASIGNTVYSTASSQSEIMMDLALIKMHCLGAERPEKIYLKEHKPKNYLLPRILPGAVCDTWETDSLGVLHDGDGKHHIKVVGKLSRTGEYTFGIVHEFRAVTFPFMENGVENKKKHYAWVVSNPASYSTQTTFSREGDSGSFVIAAADWDYCDYDNRVEMPSPQAPLKTRYRSDLPFVVGLLFGGSKNEELSYFIPFDAVKSEIESLTGEKMVWPRKRSDWIRDDVA